MGRTKWHVCLDITGGIKNSKSLCGCIETDGVTLNTPKEVRAFLRGQLAMGRRVLPVGECDNFDYQTGCKGHPIKEQGEGGKEDGV